MSIADLRRNLFWLAGALGTALLVAFTVVLWRGDVPWWLVDFDVYRFGADTVLNGGDLYLAVTPETLLSFTYPPIAAVLFTPATLASVGTAGFVWLVIESLFLVGAIWLTLEAVGVRQATHRAALTVPIALLAPLLAPVDYEFTFGQLNMMLMYLVLLDLLKGNGRRWHGIPIGIAAGIKLIPLIYVVYLACTGRLRAAVTATAAFAGTIALGFVLLPADSASFWFGSVTSMNRPGIPQGPLNQGLRGVFARMLGTDAAINPAWLATAAVVGLLGLAAASALHRKGFPVRGVAVCALTAQLVSPVSWIPHWVWVVPVLILLGALAWRHRSVWWLAVAAVVAAVFGLRLIFWFLPMEAFYVVSSPANLAMSGWHQLLAASYAILTIVLVAILAGPVLRRRDTRQDTPPAPAERAVPTG